MGAMPQLSMLQTCAARAGVQRVTWGLNPHPPEAQAVAATDAVSAPALYIDCANGVGAAPMAACLLGLGLGEQLLNTGGGGLNEDCGADFVQKELTPPASFAALPADARCSPWPCTLSPWPCTLSPSTERNDFIHLWTYD